MIIDTRFRQRYTTIPFAVYNRFYDPPHQNTTLIKLAHYHKEIEMYVITDGSAYLFSDSVAYEVQKGDIFIVSPYHPHSAKFFPDRKFSHHCICFDLEMIYDRKLCSDLENGTLTITPHISHTEPYADLLGEYIKKACLAHSTGREGWEFAVIGNLSLLFALLKEQHLIQRIKVENISNAFAIQIIDYISNNYSNTITSRDAADFLHISNGYFCRIFKTNFGVCFQNYLNLYRLEVAQKQLKYTETPIFEISIAVGFNSFSYFCKLFKDTYHCTPTEYRNLHRLKT